MKVHAMREPMAAAMRRFTMSRVRARRWAAAAALCAATALANTPGGTGPKMLDDRREVLIMGIGGVSASTTDAARISVMLNGVEFTVLTEITSDDEDDGVQPPMRTCTQLAEQIAGFAVDMSADVEFEAACAPLAADAALLAVQANPERFPVADGGAPWYATRRRFVDVEVESTDAGQRLKVVR